ncbi:alpha/beta hydrolase [Synechococcus sp. PCC 6312]|uniref:alpha/beta hydrolase n=1 Tax=Synechococcus sp. (strain ATCC 27167 / PCC 6312) TaxID=195253 RepID=UPI00029F037B|nr:alpha/beta hydrolase [Synechococcus sp. PCC 6312]AFY61233.1 Putative lysophospholipase [Synechococcus sp. PCC 6312]
MAQKWLIGEFSGWRLLKSILFVYVTVAIYLFFRADQMIFQPQGPSYEITPEFIQIPITDQEFITALYLPNPQAKWTIFYSHGNAEDLGDIRPFLNQLRDWGFNIFAYDYRGYGQSSGVPGEANAYTDALVAYTYLTQTLKIPPNQIILYGRSLGGGVATHLATEVEAAALVLESTFTSAFQVASPIPIFPFDKFTNITKLGHIQIPVLIIHGEADEVIPFAHGQALYEGANAPKFHLWVSGGSHNNISLIAREQLHQALQALRTSLEESSSTSIPKGLKGKVRP